MSEQNKNIGGALPCIVILLIVDTFLVIYSIRHQEDSLSETGEAYQWKEQDNKKNQRHTKKGNSIKKEMQDARKKLKKAIEELKSDLDVSRVS